LILFILHHPKIKKILSILLPCFLIPLTLFLGAKTSGSRQAAYVSFFLALLALLFFFTGLESKKTGSRRLVLSSLVIALCVVGRFIPFFKPISALTILAALYLGGESGFLIGSLSALISDFSFGIGPWTPFQMVAWGCIGLIAGYLSKPLKRSRFFLLFYGIISGIFFSAVMDVWTVLWYSGEFRTDLYLAALLSALPFTILYAISNFLFLWLLAKPLGQKLERIQIKYGI
jgi:energy-coupling factor transport system substrate-specific component